MNKINSRHSEKFETSPKVGISRFFSNLSKWGFAPVRSGSSLIKLFTALLVVAFLTAACSDEEDATLEKTINGITVKYLGYERDTDEVLFEVNIPEGGELASFCVSFVQVATSECWKSLPATLGSGTQEVRIKLADIGLTFEGVADKTLNIWFRSANDTYNVLVVKIPSDADGDGFADDLNSEVLGDDDAPVGVLFSLTSGSPSTQPAFEFQIEATDNVGVSGFCLLETADIPELTNDCWASVESSRTYRSSISYTVSKVGDSSLNLWFRDERGNISTGLDVIVTYTPPDTTPPTISAFTSPSGLNVTSPWIKLNLSASDNVGVTGRCVRSNNTQTPTALDSCFVEISSQTQLTNKVISLSLSSVGTYAIHAWVKDAAGNVSTSQTVSLSYAYPNANANITPPPDKH